jgi:DNA-binding transcriptional LysR family regulator
MNIKAVDLRHLHYFIAVAEELNFGRAAIRLNMAQPPLSTQIRQLEEQMGTVLFTRSRRHVALTEAGKSLLPEAKKLIGDFFGIMENTKRVGKGAHGKLQVGIIGSAPYNPVVAKILGQFAKKYPHVSLGLTSHTSGSQNDMLREGSLDLGFHWPLNKKSPRGVESLVISEGELMIAMPSHDKRSKKKLNLKDLEKEIWLHAPQVKSYSMALYNRTRQLWQAAGIRPNSKELEEVPAILLLVAAGQGISLLPDFMKNTVKHVTFVPVPRKYRKLMRYTMLLSRAKGASNGLTHNFFEVAKGIVR